MGRQVHPELGPWIAYRAIIVFEGWEIDGAPFAALAPPPPPPDPCAASEWTRVGELQTECFSQCSRAERLSNRRLALCSDLSSV